LQESDNAIWSGVVVISSLPLLAIVESSSYVRIVSMQSPLSFQTLILQSHPQLTNLLIHCRVSTTYKRTILQLTTTLDEVVMTFESGGETQITGSSYLKGSICRTLFIEPTTIPFQSPVKQVNALVVLGGSICYYSHCFC